MALTLGLGAAAGVALLPATPLPAAGAPAPASPSVAAQLAADEAAIASSAPEISSSAADVPQAPVGTTQAEAPTSASAAAAGADADAATVSALAAGGIPSTALDAYRRAAAAAPASCHLDWSLLAAIGRVESNHGRFGGAELHTDGLSSPPVLGPRLDGSGFALISDTDGGALDGDAAYDRAMGPTQFIPSTWARYASDGNGDGRRDPFNIYDAAAATARYLCAAGGDLSTTAGRVRAVLAYNHSSSYVATVLGLAAGYAGTPPPQLPTDPGPAPILPPANPAPPPALEQAAPAAAVVPAAAGTATPVTTTPSVTTTTPATTTSSATTAATTSAAPPATTTTSTSTSTTTSSTPATTTPTTTAPQAASAATPCPPGTAAATVTVTATVTPTATATPTPAG